MTGTTTSTRRRCARALLAALLCCVAGAGIGADRGDAWADARDALRRSRAHLRDGMAAFLRAQATLDAAAVEALIVVAERAPAAADRDDLVHLVAGVARLSPDLAEPLDLRLRALPADGEADAKARGAWRTEIEGTRRKVLAPLEAKAEDALRAHAADVAFDLMRLVLVFHPDHPTLHRNLGLTRHGDRWYGPREMELVRAGAAWDPRLGWIEERSAARYAAGDYFDLARKRWTTLDEADAFHSDPAHRWVIETEHLHVQGTAHLTDLVETADRLEQFYAQLFGAYAAFFAQQQDVRLIFGAADHPRLVVNVARDAEDYRRSLPAGTDAGWSAGMFIPAKAESFFYAGVEAAVYHEFTHQVLDIFGGGCRAPAWAVEGVAVYSQAPTFVDGRMELGHVDGNQHIRGWFAQRASGQALPFDAVLGLVDQRAWAAAPSDQARLNYCGAGAVVQFLMEGDGRRWRADFVDYLRDAYHGTTQGHDVASYCGTDRATLSAACEAWAHGAPSPLLVIGR